MARVCRQFLDKGIDVIGEPCFSDLNPTKNLWPLCTGKLAFPNSSREGQEAQKCPDPDLGGNHLPISGACPDVVKTTCRQVGNTRTTEPHYDMCLILATLIFRVIFNPALKRFMILVSTDYHYIILLLILVQDR